MKSYIQLFALLLCPYLLSSQEMISGIINDYAAISALDTCTNSLTLDDASNFQEGLPVLLIQMQGASLSTVNNTAFGSVLDLGSAGFYEKNEILSITGNVVVLKNQLLHPYDPAGKVQLVSIPIYEDASVDSTLTAQAWNGQTGGILIFEVTNMLILDSDIDVSGLGFRGGVAEITANNNCTFATNANNYAYSPTDWRGALKGEGIGTVPADQSTGRGAQANGGGGGNDHNAGGGGGSQIGAGGQGGENREPTFFGCDGQYPGLGGKALADLDDRLFLGGGGGAGHENNNVGTNGGPGGGIAIIVTNQYFGNGFRVRANGLAGNDTYGDGAGGGGGGGSILMLVEADLTLRLEAKGGNGGNIDNQNEARCIGPGGGGGGGRILSNLPLTGPVINLQAGTAGMSINSSDNGCPDGTNNAQNGAPGSFENLDTLLTSQLSFFPEILDQSTLVTACTNASVSIEVQVQGFDLELQWQIDTGTGFADLVEGPPYSGTQSPVLVINPVPTTFNNNQYRLIIRGACGLSANDINSQAIMLQVIPGPLPDFTFALNGTEVQFINNSQNAVTYLWDFGDSQQSDLENPMHTFATEGTYLVSLTATNACGSETITIPITVSIATAPTAAFTANPQQGCLPLQVQFSSQSTGAPSNFQWTFPGGNPASSTLENPIITYNTAGTFGATLLVSNALGVDSLVQTELIEVKDLPTGNFGFITNGLQVSFSNSSTNADTYQWLFGDTQESTQESPDHTYAAAGIYEVTLLATNECGTSTQVQTIELGTAPQAAFTADPDGACVPRTILFTNTSTGTFDGQSWSFPGGNPATSTASEVMVSYTAAGLYAVVLTLTGPFGPISLTQSDAIEILPQPQPIFSFELNGLTATFTNLSANATSYTWNFGDNTTSNLANPSHTYSQAGNYEVSLNAQNAYCGVAASQTLFLATATVDLVNTGWQVFPNPFDQELHLNYDFGAFHCQLLSLQGQVLREASFFGQGLWPLGDLPAGIYVLKLRGETEVVVKVVRFRR